MRKKLPEQEMDKNTLTPTKGEPSVDTKSNKGNANQFTFGINQNHAHHLDERSSSEVPPNANQQSSRDNG